MVRWFFILICTTLLHAQNDGIDVAKLKSMIEAEESFYLLDIRTPDIIAEGEINTVDSAAIPYKNLAKEVPFLFSDKDAVLVLYCRFGKTAKEAAKEMQALGYKNATYLQGGIEAWLNAGEVIYNAFGAMKLER